LAVAGLAWCIEFGEKPNTSQLPDSDYVVHDGTRPEPKKVKTQGVVTIPAPADAKILFDGGNLDAWIEPKWTIKDRCLVAAQKNLLSRDSFDDCQLHIEWRVPKDRKVKGQSGGNSGVFFMNRYEVQILESFENKTYPDGQAGAMYGQYPPLVNPSAPQGEWQSYDIAFKAPRYEGDKCVSPAILTVFHNGVLIHHGQPYLGPTSHRRVAKYPGKHSEKAPLKLQWHGDPIEFRNIWIREVREYDQK